MKKSTNIVKRFYLQNGEHLYPEGGYDNIERIEFLTPSLFCVCLNKKAGLVTEYNEEVLPLEYSNIIQVVTQIKDKYYIKVIKEECKHGIVRLEKKNEKWISTVVIPCKWKYLSDVSSDGWIQVESKENKIGMVNVITGAKIEPAYEVMGEFSHGLAPVGIITGRIDIDSEEESILEVILKHRCIFKHRWGMINEKGELIVPIQYSDEEFEEIKPELISKYGTK